MTETSPTPIEAELERLRERLAYYESFDQLIQKSVGDAGEILREAIELREAATRETEEADVRTRAMLRDQLESFRSLCSEMLDDVTALQGVAERLARRLADAVDALEADLQPDVAFPSLPHSLNPEIAASIEEPIEIHQSVEDEGLQSLAATAMPSIDAESTSPVLPHPGKPLPSAGLHSGRFILLVHGVPNAATALSLKTHLDSLPSVSLVEPREFASGVLRLQLSAERDLERHDLVGWSSGKDVEVVLSRPGLLEVKLV